MHLIWGFYGVCQGLGNRAILCALMVDHKRKVPGGFGLVVWCYGYRGCRLLVPARDLKADGMY
jgi:hypothetical protein